MSVLKIVTNAVLQHQRKRLRANLMRAKKPNNLLLQKASRAMLQNSGYRSGHMFGCPKLKAKTTILAVRKVAKAKSTKAA